MDKQEKVSPKKGDANTMQGDFAENYYDTMQSLNVSTGR